MPGAWTGGRNELEGPQTGIRNELTAVDWWSWFEQNQLEWLAPNRIESSPRTGPERTHAEGPLEELRRELAPLLARHLRDPQANVRAAAAVAVARSAGPFDVGDVEDLLPLLQDSSLYVRESAILALGASGSQLGVHPLLWIARTGTLPREIGGGEGGELGPRARELAVLSLGLVRTYSATGFAAMLPADAEEDEDLALALILHQGLAPSPEKQVAVREASGLFAKSRRHERLSHRAERNRARAVETVWVDAGAEPDALVAAIAEAAEARDVEVRRSAAAALGKLGDPSALKALGRAYLVEEDALARGLMLISIGRLGGEKARKLLIKELRFGSQSVRCWSALALGVLAREGDDDLARTILRDRGAKDRSSEVRSAILLACGIAGDREAIPMLGLQLQISQDARTRRCAGFGLTVARAASARDDLRQALETEPDPTVRVELARCLAVLGDSRDAGLLLDLLKKEKAPSTRTFVALALAFHGSPEAARGIAGLLEDGDLSSFTRASLLQALGVLLSRDDPYQLARLALGSNPSVLPDWLHVPIASSI